MHPGILESDPKRRMFPAYRFYAEPIMLPSANLVAILLHHMSLSLSHIVISPRRGLMCFNSQGSKIDIASLARMQQKINEQSCPWFNQESALAISTEYLDQMT